MTRVTFDRPLPMRPSPVLLLILDGWGDNPSAEHNAIAHGHAPYWQALKRRYPTTQLATAGHAVGLPDGQMGNSEVGHMNLGAGRVVYQDFTRIELAIARGELAQISALANAIADAKMGATLHVFGLLSPGGVHSHEAQILAFIDAAFAAGATRVAVHAFLDGRDTPPRSAHDSLAELDRRRAREPRLHMASVSGRYYAMDRDQRWERVGAAWSAIVDAQSAYHATSAVAALEAAYARQETDEFVQPTVIEPTPIGDGDVVVFMNFRADRARQLSRAFRDPKFSGFDRPRVPTLKRFVTLTEYEATLDAEVAFAPTPLNDLLGEIVANAGLTQLRIAETEKYAHVTFFFNGGREAPFVAEERILIPSPKVATYDLQPEMSLPELTDALVSAIESKRFGLIVCNIANGDMVGHTGDFGAALKAVAAVDQALERIVSAIETVGGAALITADHGNIELMWDDQSNQPNTQHTTFPVPLIAVGNGVAALAPGGALQDVAPSLLDLLKLPQPAAMTGRSRLQRSA
jgi:2,3-bisphosphoglycerate-independent phosphoglycerate mutase